MSHYLLSRINVYNPERCLTVCFPDFRTKSNFRRLLQIFSEICKFSQQISIFEKNAIFRRNLQIFDKKPKKHFRKNNMQTWKEICEFSQRNGNHRCNFSQKSVNVIFSTFRAPGPQAYSNTKKTSNYRVLAPNQIA